MLIVSLCQLAGRSYTCIYFQLYIYPFIVILGMYIHIYPYSIYNIGENTIAVMGILDNSIATATDQWRFVDL